MTQTLETLEVSLDTFDPEARRDALDVLLNLVKQGEVSLPEPRDAVNVHSHTFFSYNGYGYSPTGFAWRARKAGLTVAGIVDFDVLDGVSEFLDAAARVGLRGCAGLETRVYIPELAEFEINSPGEPGIAYHMGIGFTSSSAGETAGNAAFLEGLKAAAQARNRSVLDRVNRHLAPLAVDYEADVLPLTPNGNPTERHLCAAYAVRAAQMFPVPADRAAFWADKLSEPVERVTALLENPPGLEGLIRAKTMKAGGPGYVQPGGSEFPELTAVNRFVRAQGAIPTATWLDGARPGEADPEALLELHAAHGAAAVNIIPDRNWNLKDPDEKARKVANLYAFTEAASRRGMPIAVGTEMNAPGQRFVDAFEATELAPVRGAFLDGAFAIYGHTILQCAAGMGFVSAWAEEHFPALPARSAFYARIGRVALPGKPRGGFPGPDTTPQEALTWAEGR